MVRSPSSPTCSSPSDTKPSAKGTRTLGCRPDARKRKKLTPDLVPSVEAWAVTLSIGAQRTLGMLEAILLPRARTSPRMTGQTPANAPKRIFQYSEMSICKQDDEKPVCCQGLHECAKRCRVVVVLEHTPVAGQKKRNGTKNRHSGTELGTKNNIIVWCVCCCFGCVGCVVCGAAGALTRQPENSKRAHFRAPALQKPHQNSTKGPPRERRKKENCGGEGKKSAKFCPPPPPPHPSGPHPSAPTLRGPHPSGPPPSTLRGHPLGAPLFGAPPFRAPTFRGPTILGLGSCFFCPVCQFSFCPTVFFVPFVIFYFVPNVFFFVPFVFFLSRAPTHSLYVLSLLWWRARTPERCRPEGDGVCFLLA